MKLLFLDIDGVLNSTERARQGIPYSELNPVALRWIQSIASQGVLIVVSSTWRYHMNRFELASALGIFGDKIAMTPKLRAERRGTEIAAFLDILQPEVYAIIDDDSDMLEEQLPYFVKTSHETGMTMKEYMRVAEILGVNIES